jgi:hypothetical protein
MLTHSVVAVGEPGVGPWSKLIIVQKTFEHDDTSWPEEKQHKGESFSLAVVAPGAQPAGYEFDPRVAQRRVLAHGERLQR